MSMDKRLLSMDKWLLSTDKRLTSVDDWPMWPDKPPVPTHGTLS